MRLNRSLAVVCTTSVVGCLLPHVAFAQTAAAPTPSSNPVAPGTYQQAPQAQVDELTAKLKTVNENLKTVHVNVPQDFAIGVAPALTGLIPTGYGASPGAGGVGAIFQNRTRFNNTSDGAIGLLLGLGEPGAKTSLDVGVNILDVGINGDSFGSRGSFNVKAHTKISRGKGLAVGVLNFGNWNVTDNPRGVFGVFSFQNKLRGENKAFGRLYTSVGLGNGLFLSEKKIQQKRGGVNVFGSLTTNLTSRVNAFTEWTGQDMNIGLSIVPFKRQPIVITPMLADVTHRAGDGTRFLVGMAYGFTVSTDGWK